MSWEVIASLYHITKKASCQTTPIWYLGSAHSMLSVCPLYPSHHRGIHFCMICHRKYFEGLSSPHTIFIHKRLDLCLSNLNINDYNTIQIL